MIPQSAAAVYETLLHRYPHKFDIPSKGEVGVEIQRLCRLQKLGRDLAEPVKGKRGRKGMKNIYSSFVEEIVRRNPAIKPRDGLLMFKKHFPTTDLPEDFPNDKQLKSKLSSIKQSMRKDQGRMRD